MRFSNFPTGRHFKRQKHCALASRMGLNSLTCCVRIHYDLCEGDVAVTMYPIPARDLALGGMDSISGTEAPAAIRALNRESRKFYMSVGPLLSVRGNRETSGGWQALAFMSCHLKSMRSFGDAQFKSQIGDTFTEIAVSDLPVTTLI